MPAVTAVPIRPLARGAVLKLWLGILVLALAAAGLAWWGTEAVQRETTASGLQYQVIEAGEGATVTSADLLLIHFVGRRANGEIFANTLGQQPVETSPDNFIPGFGEGLKLMRKGAHYRLWIPPHLGYQGNLPPSAPFGPEETLIFDLRIVDVAPGMAAAQRMQQLQQMMQQQQQGQTQQQGQPQQGAPPPPPAGGRPGGR